MLQLVSHHVIENQEIGFTKFHQVLAGNVSHNYYMPGTTTKLSMQFHALVLCLHMKEIFSLGLGLTVTDITSGNRLHMWLKIWYGEWLGLHRILAGILHDWNHH